MRHWVDAQAALGAREGLNFASGRSRCLEDFFAHYLIDPEEYSWDSAYRRLTRASGLNDLFLREELRKKFDFCESDNQAFTLTRISWSHRRPFIYFFCYSSTREDVIRKCHRIPARLYHDQTWEPYARRARAIIDDFLKNGYVVDGPPQAYHLQLMGIK